MKRFTSLFIALDQTTKTNVKVEALHSYFNEAPDKDKVWVIALLSHKRPKRIISTSFLKSWAAEIANIPDWLFDESYHVVGDLAETIALLIPQQSQHKEKTLDEWILYLAALKGKDPEVVKTAIIDSWKGLDNHERFIFNKLMTGGFRMGVSQKIMVKGLSKSTGIEENILTHRIMGNWNPFDTDFESLIYEDQTDFDNARPYPFFLAYPLENIDKELGDVKDWYAEYKWDGIRGQIVKRNHEVSIWSRGEELVTDKFPELVAAATHLPDGCVLDGEILPWRDGVLDFQVLQTRLGRKTVGKKLLADAPVVFMAYDLLELNGSDIREKPMAERAVLLETLMEGINHENFLLSTVYADLDLQALEELRSKARDIGAEGLMLKQKSSSYGVGRKKGGWYKWKLDPYTIDAVLTFGMRGHGRRANLYTDYTFGLWHEGELITFAKAYSGLTDEEFRAVDAFIKKNTIDKFGPVRQVKPELVFELAFEGISVSKRHKSGIAVRFPRIHRWRKDKKPAEANSLADLKALKGIPASVDVKEKHA